jgi:5-methylcytosine-specific restriction protein B
MANEFSKECVEVLERLSTAKNVLVSGPPGTGKSRLLGEVARAFEIGIPKGGQSPVPVHNPKSQIPIPPAALDVGPGFVKAMPAAGKGQRKVFRTVFHQNSKHRDFATGMVPNTARKPGEPDFIMLKGVLYVASEHAKQPNGASLLVIDEINRGPAVQVFGGAIVSVEADKRLDAAGKATRDTQFFDLLDPSGKGMMSYALPEDLYILAAMNQADASVEPMDVAFLRRWEPYILDPSSDVLRAHYGIAGANAVVGELPSKPSEAKHVLEACVRAWEKVNRRITLGRGPEFQIGHGVVMYGKAPAMTLDEALRTIATRWLKARAHVQEIFFGDLRAIAATLNAIDGPDYHPLRLEEVSFADDVRFELKGPSYIGPDRIYDALRAIAG